MKFEFSNSFSTPKILKKLVQLEKTRITTGFLSIFVLILCKKVKILIKLIRKVEKDFRKKIRIRSKNLKLWKFLIRTKVTAVRKNGIEKNRNNL